MFGLGIGTSEVIVLCVLGLLLFGKHLPRLARSLGQTVSEVRNQINEVKEDVSIR